MALMNPLLGSNLVTGAAPFNTTLISKSVWLDGSADGLTAPSSTFSAQDGKEFTLGTWIQLNQMGVSEGFFCAGASPYTSVRHDDDNKFYFQTEAGSAILKTQAVFRDIGWYHVLVSVDTTQSTAGNRVRLFVNGTEQTLDGTQPSVNHAYEFNTAVVHEVGDSFENGAFKGYLAQSFMIGSKSIQQGDFAITDFLDTYTFGTNGSQFIPKKHSEIKTLVDAGSSNSFLLDYEPADPTASNALGLDTSTHGNNFTSTSMDSANQSLNSPSKVYTTWNALDSALDGHHTDMALSEGNTVTENGNGAFCRSTFSIPEGLFSYRVTVDDSTAHQLFGVALNTAAPLSTGTDAVAGLYTVSAFNGERNTNGSGSSAVSGYSWSDGDTMEVYVSRSGTTYKIWYGKNGTLLNNASGSQGDPSAGTNELFSFTHTEDVFFGVHYVNPGTKKATTDFGQRGYSPAEGALTLSSNNIPAPTYQGIDYFDATLYEGNGQNQRVGDFVPFTDTYTVSKSAMFDKGDVRYLAKTFDSDDATATSDPGGSASAQATISFWMKFCSSGTTNMILSASDSTERNRFILYINDQAGQQSIVMTVEKPGGGMSFQIPIGSISNLEWTNLVYNIDLDNGTGADKIKCWVNGVQQTSTDTGYQSADNTRYHLFSNKAHFIGNLAPVGGDFSGTNGYSGFAFNSYLAEMHVIDGSLKSPSDFGQVDTSTNRWVAKDYKTNVGTYGNRGFYMAFDNASGTSDGVGTDSSGNGFHFTETAHATAGSAWTATDTVTDTPSKNFAVMNPGDQDSSTATTLSEGNLKVSMSTTAGDGIRGTLPYSGKMYWEVELDSVSTNSGSDIGIATKNHNLSLVADSSSNTNAFVGISSFDSNLRGFIHNSALDVSYGGLGSNFATAGKFLMFAVDIDAGKFWAGYDGTFFNSGNPAAGTNDSGIDLSAHDTWFPAISRIGSAGSENFIFNFGQRSFAHTPPTGFSNLNQDNLDDTASKLTAWAWIKNRDADDSHILVDRVRGVGEVLHSDVADLEATELNTVQRFLQRGVQVGSDVQVNTANESYVLWQWLVGDSATTGTVFSADNPPSLASTVIAADADHFSVGTYTGDGGTSATIKHGLSAAPEMIWVKNRSVADEWLVGTEHNSFASPWNYYAHLETTGNFAANSNAWNNTEPSTSAPFVFTVGTSDRCNASGENYVFYAFRSVPGVCKVGSYEGNNLADGTYVSLGFTPAWFLAKNVDATGSWFIIDNKRGFNSASNEAYLQAESNTTETVGNVADLLSDGIKWRTTGGPNASNTFVYIAMADIAGNGRLPPLYGR